MTNDFLFHKLSDKEKEDVKNEAKLLLEKFSDKISKIPKNLKEHSVDREDFEREEKNSEESKSNEDFRKRVLENAPSKSKDFILAEKKGW